MDKEALFERRLGEGKHEIEGVITLRIRGYSRIEALELQAQPDANGAVGDRWMLARCILHPVLTEDEIKVWQENSPPMEIQAVCNAIRDLSGMGPGAAKSGVSGVRE